jgi:hypothetical protein
MKKKEKTLADLIENLCQAINYLDYCREADENDWEEDNRRIRKIMKAEAEENIEKIKKSINELLTKKNT